MLDDQLGIHLTIVEDQGAKCLVRHAPPLARESLLIWKYSRGEVQRRFFTRDYGPLTLGPASQRRAGDSDQSRALQNALIREWKILGEVLVDMRQSSGTPNSE